MASGETLSDKNESNRSGFQRGFVVIVREAWMEDNKARFRFGDTTADLSETSETQRGRRAQYKPRLSEKDQINIQGGKHFRVTVGMGST